MRMHILYIDAQRLGKPGKVTLVMLRSRIDNATQLSRFFLPAKGIFMKKILALTIGMVAVIGLAACSTPQPTSPTSAQQGSMNSTTALQAYHWMLSTVTAQDQPPAAAPTVGGGKPLILDFSNQRVSVNGLCNLLSGSYTLAGDRMDVSQIVSTLKACPDSQLMRYEQDIGQRLPTVSNWNVDTSTASPTLVLSFGDGTQWTLQGEATAATLYGGEPERIFLEVAPQRVACSPPLIPDYQCLHVREITYDERGIKTGAGDWRYYYDGIQGYEHQAGVRNILRINRYTRENPPADASSTVDILDMVVESETTAAQ